MSSTNKDKNRTAVQGLGEIALRVNNLDTREKFYAAVTGLTLMSSVPDCAFFKVADGYDGHSQVLALFDRSASPGYRGTDAAKSTVDHIAFEIALADFDNEKSRLEALGLAVTTAEHAWVHWRSLYVNDPEGNEIELVCYDSSVGSGATDPSQFHTVPTQKSCLTSTNLTRLFQVVIAGRENR